MPTAEYEPQFERISRIRQEMYAIFKNSNLPGKVRDDWIMSIERLDAEVKNAKSLRNTAVVKAISHIIATITFGKNWPHLLLNANLERDYQRLQDNLDDLFNTPLYYQAARIQRLYGR